MSRKDWSEADYQHVPELRRLYIEGIWPRVIEVIPVPPPELRLHQLSLGMGLTENAFADEIVAAVRKHGTPCVLPFEITALLA